MTHCYTNEGQNPEEVGHLCCACDCALDSTRFCTCKLHVLHSYLYSLVPMSIWPGTKGKRAYVIPSILKPALWSTFLHGADGWR